MAIRPIRISVVADANRARKELAGLGQTMKRGLTVVGVGGFTAGLAAFAKSAVDTEREFSLTMRTIQANTGATAAEIDKMGKLAVKAGGDMGFSAREAAGAMLELAKAGLDTRTIMGGGLQGTLTLAAAGGTDLATASTIAANAMNAFSLAGKDMDSIAAALAGGANASTASVESLGIALSQVGPGATTAGLSLQETIATLAAFDNAGIKGSDAGTSLKTMLTRLVPGTKAAANEMARLNLDFTKADGSFVSLEQIAGRLRTSLGKLSAEERTNALRKIFGSDATRAATVLTREGTEGIRKYIKATQDQTAAQKAVEARTSGTEGAIKRMNAAIEKAKLQLGAELAPAVIAGANAFGDKLIPAVESGIKAGKQIGQALTPAAREIAEALRNLTGEGEGVGKFFNDTFIPALETTATVVGKVVNFIDELPGPVKETGVQVAIAALVFPRFAAGVATATGAVSLQIARLQQLRAELTYTATRAQLTAAAMAKVAAAAKAAAGIGGLVLLTQGMQQSNIEAKALLTTMGGIATGFAVGGPVGAVIGGIGGLFLGLKDHITGAKEATKLLNEEAARTQAMIDYKKALEGVRETLDQLTGASTQTTRQWALQRLQEEDVLQGWADLGISQRTAVSAVLGNKKAIAELTAAVGGADPVIETLNAEFREQQAATRDAADATATLAERLGLTGSELKRIPKNVRLAIEDDVPDSLREIRALNTQVNGLDNKTIKILLKAADLPATQANIRKVKKEIEGLGDTKPRKSVGSKVKADIDALRAAVKPQITTFNTILSKAGDVKPNLVNGPFGRGVSADLTAISGTARTKSQIVGLNLGSGMYNGVSAWAGPIAAKARQIVLDAVAAANAAGDIHSPSRKTHETGTMLGAGLEGGLRASRPAARTAGQKLMLAVLSGVDDGADGISRAIEAVTAAARKSITGKNQGKREAAYLKSLRDEYAALRANGRAQDRVAAKLEKARDKLKELTDQYADYKKAIVDSVKATGDVTQLGRNEDDTVSITSLINELKNKVVAAQRFSSLLQQLAQQGLSQTSIQQMLDAGPEAALATAEAIASGGASAIAEINALQAELAKTGTQLGGSMADRYYGAGVQAAKGLVAGLEAEAKALDKAATTLATSLVKAVKRALGIKSPSRVFAEVGDNVVKGLQIGLDDTYVKRSGETLAASLQKGFGTPALEAFASQNSDSGNRVLTLRLTADQLDRLSRGKQLQADLDYARSNGVRGETF